MNLAFKPRTLDMKTKQAKQQVPAGGYTGWSARKSWPFRWISMFKYSRNSQNQCNKQYLGAIGFQIKPDISLKEKKAGL